MNKRYVVVEDRQGGGFGMGRAYTAKEWLDQAVAWRDSDDSWGDYGEGVDCYGNKHLDSRSWFIKFWKRIIADGKEQELIDYIGDIWDLEFAEGAECDECGECWSIQELDSYSWHCLKCGHKLGD